ncbi:MAG: Uma2 family endonuclease [Planctomycetes bacterium]|nr:Uma2 family endonuclease [Planctomycetota bacterium]
MSTGTHAAPPAAPRQQALAAPRVPPFPIYPISVQKYHEMIQKGILTEDDPVELLEGWIAIKTPRVPAHDTAIDLAEAALRPVLPPGWRVRVQNAITTDDSQPEPDVAVVSGDLRAFAARHPGPADTGLVLEAVESSLDTDRVEKGRIYARAAIPIYWIINLVDRQVEVYSDPDPRSSPPAYRRRETYLPGQTVPLVLKGQAVAQVPAQDLLP